MADVILTETHGRVRVITLNRPEAKNSVNSELGLALVWLLTMNLVHKSSLNRTQFVL